MNEGWDETFYRDDEKMKDAVFRIPHKDLPLFIQLLQDKRGKNILDLGCGTGRNILPLVKADFNVWGIDISTRAIAEAKTRLQEEHLQADIKVGDFYTTLPYPDDFFDGVLSIKAMHHARRNEIDNLIKELKRIMCIGGILMVEVPKKGRKSRWQFEEIEPDTVAPLAGPEKGIPHHVFENEADVISLFPNFEVLDIHTTGQDTSGTPSSHFTMFAKLKSKAF